MEQTKKENKKRLVIGMSGASIASGTFKIEGMIIVPCSMKTVAGITCGYSDNLLLRAADVTIKERSKLIILPRETPLSTIHLRNMLSLSELGAIIMPPMLTYYNKPRDINDLNKHIVGKVFDRFGIEVKGFNRWGEEIGDLNLKFEGDTMCNLTFENNIYQLIFEKDRIKINYRKITIIKCFYN